MEENQQPTQPESAPTPSDASSQTPPPQDNQSDTGSAAQQPPATTTSTDEKWVFDGNFDKLKESHPEMMRYATGIRRYATSKDQEHADKIKQADEYQRVQSTDAWKQFVQTYTQRPQPQQPQQEEAYVDPDTQKYVEEKESVYKQQMEALNGKVERLTRENEIALFADAHPQFWEYDQKGLIRPYLREGMSLARAFEKAETVVQSIRNDSVKQQQEVIAKKQNASASINSNAVVNESDIVWVDHPNEVLDAATELAFRGEKNKQVRVRKK